MPSLEVSDFAYAALLYPNDSDEKGEFAKGDVAGEKTLSFSFPRPESTEKLTIEIFAFKTGTTAFSEDDAILWGSASMPGPVGADGILNVGTVKLEVKSGCEALGEVSLKVQVPADCTLEISGEYAGKFKCKKDDDDSNTYTISQADEAGIPAKAYQLILTVKKGGSLLYVLSEYINVLPGMCTNKWSDPTDDGARVIDDASFSTTVYVRGSRGWYDTNYADTATADEGNFGSFLAPLKTIQKAVDKVLAMNDGKSPYTIYVDGMLTQAALADGARGMADFYNLDKDLNLTIKALSPDNGATLDADGLSRVIYASLTAGSSLTLENLTITGGNAGNSSGGGVFINGGTLILQSGTISGNSTGSSGSGGGICVNNGTFIMKGGTIGGSTDDENSANTGGGVYVGTRGTFTMSGGEIVGNTANYGGGVYMISDGIFNMTGGSISDNNATYYGGGVYVGGSCEFTMGGEAKISGNTANTYGGGVYVKENAVFNMTGGTIDGGGKSNAQYGGGVYVEESSVFTMEAGSVISDNTVGTWGGGVYVNKSTFIMKGGTISGNSIKSGGGAGVYAYYGTFTMEGGTIGGSTPDECNTASNGGGIYMLDSNFTMKDGAKIIGNKSMGTNPNNGGGGVFFSQGGSTTKTMKMEGGTISDNIANRGGGVFVERGTLAVSGGMISSNTASVDGGGVFVYSPNRTGTFTMSDAAKISGNTATGNGGGVYVGEGSVFTMEGGTISDNEAAGTSTTSGGGGVYVLDSTFTMSGGTISENTATKDGGGVYTNGNASEFNMTAGKIAGNKAEGLTESSGGGVTVYQGTFNMSGSAEISGNTAKHGGGAYVKSGGKFNMGGGTISNNRVSYYGGGVYIHDNESTFEMNGGTIGNENNAGWGGGVYVYTGTFTMNNGTITGNTARDSSGGGGVFVYVYVGGIFNQKGGTVSGNTPDQIMQQKT